MERVNDCQISAKKKVSSGQREGALEHSNFQGVIITPLVGLI